MPKFSWRFSVFGLNWKVTLLILLVLLAVGWYGTTRYADKDSDSEISPKPTYTVPSFSPVQIQPIDPCSVLPSEGFISFIDHNMGFCIWYPDGWEQIPVETVLEMWEGYPAVGFWPTEACGETIPICNVVKEELPYAMDVWDYFDIAKSYVVELEGYTHISEEELTLSGMKAVQLIYTAYPYDQHVEVMQTCFIKDKTAWIVGVSCSPTCWSEYIDNYNTIVASFYPK